MKRKVIPIIIVGFLVLPLLACGQTRSGTQGTNPTATVTAAATATPRPPVSTATAAPLVTAPASITGIGEVAAVQDADLFFTVPGTVGAVYVEEGDTVAQDQLVAMLDTRPFDQDIRQAEAAVADAQARQARLTDGPRAADVQAARARIAQAEATLVELRAGPKTQDVQEAESRLDQARVTLQSQRDALSTAKVQAESQITQVANLVRDLQATYSRIYWENRELENELARGGDELPQERKDLEEEALRAVETAEQDLEQARLAYEQAQKEEITGIQAAEESIVQAQTALDRLFQPADPDEIATAEAALAQAQADLDRLFPSPTQAELNQAAAAIVQAQSRLESARLNREYAELRAPFAGVVSVVTIDPGDPSGAGGQPVMHLVDTSTLRVEVAISDVDIARVSLGQSARVSVEALPETPFTGTVSYIAPSADVAGGLRTFEVHIALDDQAGLQDGMSVRVELLVAE